MNSIQNTQNIASTERFHRVNHSNLLSTVIKCVFIAACIFLNLSMVDAAEERNLTRSCPNHFPHGYQVALKEPTNYPKDYLDAMADVRYTASEELIDLPLFPKDDLISFATAISRGSFLYNASGNITTSRWVWITLDEDLRDTCQHWGLQGDLLRERLEQLLGLPPNTPTQYQKVAIALGTVPREGLRRPCFDSQFNDEQCRLEPQDNKEPFNQALCDHMRSSYYPERYDPYPFTGVGYTYDWAKEAAPSHMGLPEYLIQAEMPVQIRAVMSIDAYCKPTVAVIGGGPAALTAAQRLRETGHVTVIAIADVIGGIPQSLTHTITNWHIEANVTGKTVGKILINRAVESGVQILQGRVTSVDFGAKPYLLTTASGDKIPASHVLIATGSCPLLPKIPTLADYMGKGVFTYSACDDLFLKNRTVVVVGAANGALVTAENLLNQCAAKVFWLVNDYRIWTNDMTRLDGVLSNRNLEVVYNSELTEILGSGDKITNVLFYNGTLNSIAVQAIAFANGRTPDTHPFCGPLLCETSGAIRVDDRQQTSLDGIYAAGDATGQGGNITFASESGRRAAEYLLQKIPRGRKLEVSLDAITPGNL